MNDNDLIRRGDVLARKCKYHVYDEAGFCRDEFAVPVEDIECIPPVPHEMSAGEFVRAHHRMCQSKKECVECRICHDDGEPRSCAVLMGLDPDETVAVVEQWAREHPEDKEE